MHNSMKFLAIVELCALCVLAVPTTAITMACNPPVVPINAIAAAQAAAQTATTVVSDAQAAWPIVKALLPADMQAAAQSAFDKAVFVANHAILVLNDAISAAIASNTTNPDFSALLSSLGDAVSQIVAVVQEFHGKAPAAVAKTSSGVDAFADMQWGAEKLKTK